MKHFAITVEKMLPLTFVVIAFLAFSIPELMNGYRLSDDAMHGIIRIKEYQVALTNNQWPPFWAENLYGGSGSPIFLFYAPLFMFVATLFYMITGSVIAGSMMSIFLFTMIAAIGIYLLIIEIVAEESLINKPAARISIYMFILNPYMIGDKVVRHANAEYIALCLSPLAIYGVLKLKKNPLLAHVVLSAALALVILSHNLTALTVFVLVHLLFIVVCYSELGLSTLSYFLWSIVLGLLMSSFFWLPAIFYKSLVHIEDLTVQGFNFSEHFKPISELFFNSDYFSMGFLNLCVILKVAHSLWVNKAKSNIIFLKTFFSYLCFLFFFKRN